MSIPYLVSKEKYLLSDISRSGCPLPLPYLVNEGFYGERCWDTVSAGEVIFLNKLVKIPRALAMEIGSQRHFSVPLDYPVHFSIISGKNKGSPKPIDNIVKNYNLPVTIQIELGNKTLSLGKNFRKVVHMGNIVVKKVYDESFLTGNSIIQNELQRDFIMLPIVSEVKVSTIEGIRGATVAEFVSLLELWNREAQIYHKESLPSTDIVMFLDVPKEVQSEIAAQKEVVYETLGPKTYVKLEFNEAPKQDSYIHTGLKPVKAGNDTYSDLTERRDNSRKHVYESLSMSSTSTPVNTETDKGVYRTLSTEPVIYGNYGEKFSSTNKTLPNDLQSLQNELVSTLSLRYSKNKRAEYASSSSTSSSNDGLPTEFPSSLHLKINNNKLPPAPPPKRHSKQIDVDVPSSTISSFKSRQSVDFQSDMNSQLFQIQSNTLDQKTPPQLSLKQCTSQSLPHKDNSEIDTTYKITPRQNSRIHSFQDIPETIEGLNCEEIADSLRLLKMSMYIDIFLANQINGELLMQLDEQILIEVLQMTPFHAKKLTMFGKNGWRP